MLRVFLLITILIYSKQSFASYIDDKKFSSLTSLAFDYDGTINLGSSEVFQKKYYQKDLLPDGLTANLNNKKNYLNLDLAGHLKYGYMSNNGSKFGVIARFEYVASSGEKNLDFNLDRAFLFAENDLGKFEIGNNLPVNQMMKVGPARFATAAGGINGKYLENINLPMLADYSSSSQVCGGGFNDSACKNIKMPSFILLAQSPIGHGGYAKGFYRNNSSNEFSSNGKNYVYNNQARTISDQGFEGIEDGSKISYYSPRISGLQFGASYTPNPNNQGLTQRVTRTNDYNLQDVLSIGINYVKYFDDIGFASSFTGESGQVKNSRNNVRVDDLLSYDLAISVSYLGATLGASYGSWLHYMQPLSGIYSCNYNPNKNLSDQTCLDSQKKFSNPRYLTLGASYKIGPLATSITAISSRFQNNNYQAISLGVDYHLTKSLKPYFEITNFKFKSNNVIGLDILDQNLVANSVKQLRDNHGYVILTGISYIF